MTVTSKKQYYYYHPVTVSAPGKILLVGGYLVLESPNPGLVVAADKRFYTKIEAEENDNHDNDNDDNHNNNYNLSTSSEKVSTSTITVLSPQFHNQWKYDYTTVTTTTTTTTISPTTTTTTTTSDDDTGRQNTVVMTTTTTLNASMDNNSIHPWIEKSLRICLLYYLQPNNVPKRMTITIIADNDFYSVLPHLPTTKIISKDDDEKNDEKDKDIKNVSTIDRTLAAVTALPKFLNCPVESDGDNDKKNGKVIVNKTGLGSSAALITSLVGALVYFFIRNEIATVIIGNHNNNDDDDDNKEDEETGEGKAAGSDLNDMIHNLAQICHCHAQGKVGSGFDISAACYGTHIYQRFPKCLLPDVLQQLDDVEEHSDHDTENLKDTLMKLVEWVPWKTNMVQDIPWSKGPLQVLLADVRGGSESPSMAKTVLKWKADHPGSEVPHWSSLSKLNVKVIELIQQLCTLEETSSSSSAPDYDTFATLPANEWPQNSPLKMLHDTFLEIRSDLRDMGRAAGVPIEPPPQTALCDATMSIPGVVAAVVPGAGGYDAVVCLYIDRPCVLQAIDKVWSGWSEPIICPLAVQAGDSGLRVEEHFVL